MEEVYLGKEERDKYNFKCRRLLSKGPISPFLPFFVFCRFLTPFLVSIPFHDWLSAKLEFLQKQNVCSELLTFAPF